MKNVLMISIKRQLPLMSEKREMIQLRNYTHQSSKIHIRWLKECSVAEMLSTLLRQ